MKRYCIVVQITHSHMIKRGLFFARIGKGDGKNGTKISRLPRLSRFSQAFPFVETGILLCNSCWHERYSTRNKWHSTSSFSECCELQGSLVFNSQLSHRCWYLIPIQGLPPVRPIYADWAGIWLSLESSWWECTLYDVSSNHWLNEIHDFHDECFNFLVDA